MILIIRIVFAARSAYLYPHKHSRMRAIRAGYAEELQVSYLKPIEINSNNKRNQRNFQVFVFVLD